MSENGKESRGNQIQLVEDGRSNSAVTGGVLSSTSDRAQQQTSLGQLTQQFVEEIDYDEIETEEVVGKGSFGVVWKGRWRGRYVAIKHIDTEGERRAFAVEVRQLSRVAHPNIVRLYGACTRNPVCLVMEYAEGGSLYNVLHCEPQPRYTAAHAISWALQCANGVAYLHNMKPKPLIHRDLKPPNLLLVFGGRTLKICDFGTACDLNTYMTNNKGSAAWMAPEVFEGSRYTEKCDVFSWGVILWEILSRRKPFDDIGGSAYRIMWAVHIGQRPPLLEGCPRPIEQLIVQCWRKIPEERPSMNEVVRIMTHLSEFFLGHPEPLDYSSASPESSDIPETNDEENNEAACWMPKYERTVLTLSSQIPDNGNPPLQPLHIQCDPDAWELSQTDSSWKIRNLESLDKVLSKNHNINKTLQHSELDNMYRLLDVELRPLTPDYNSRLSQDIFQQHKQLAQEYLKVQTEIALLGQHKSETLESLSTDALNQLELQKLQDEKESLVKLYRNLKRQLEIMRAKSVALCYQTANDHQTVPGDDGWVLVPRPELPRLS
ncbi:mitogen-activated protein kinase kinase kinase 7-like [Venturia canescens]|uniref:mitogen-activated protein kinase kinase kinase 7-like n=1 Tax=Venturia canescens TaxID=32260 RepID=UPI001C9D64C5|nr:mitogen-activated protein kinase kinase kinase 7-like [Venturia canescens]